MHLANGTAQAEIVEPLKLALNYLPNLGVADLENLQSLRSLEGDNLLSDVLYDCLSLLVLNAWALKGKCILDERAERFFSYDLISDLKSVLPVWRKSREFMHNLSIAIEG
jgi:hypothetical protein